MIPVDAGFVYPKTGLDADLRFNASRRFVSSGSTQFTQGSSRVDFTNPNAFTNFSWTCWFQFTAGASSLEYMGWAPNVSWGIDSSGDLKFYDKTTSTSYQSTNVAVDVSDDLAWHHLAYTLSSGGALKGYLDGQEFAMAQPSGGITIGTSTGTTASGIGSFQAGGGGSIDFNGSLCHVGWFASVLTQENIRDLMKCSTYAEVQAVATPAYYFLLEENTNDSASAVASIASTGINHVGNRARLPSGFDLVSTRLDARSVSGRCVDLDGTADGMYGTTTFDINGSGDTTTLSCWFYADTDTVTIGGVTKGALSGANTTIVGNTKSNTTNNFAIYTTGTNEVAAIAYYASSTHVKVSTGSVLTTGKWYHVAATFDKDSTTIKIYLDGKECSGSPSLAYGGTDNTFEIGFRWLGGGVSTTQYFNGKIADVKMFDIAFSAAQALEQYQNPEQTLPTGASASNLKRWYPLSEYGTATSTSLDGLYALDASGNGKNLLIKNSGTGLAQVGVPQLGLRSSSSRIYFDQSDDKVTVGNNAAINGLFGSGGSIAFWLNCFSDGGGTYGRIIETTGYMCIVQSESSGNIQLRFDATFGGSSNGTWVGPAASLVLGTWNHVVITYNGSSDTNEPLIYINGSSVTVTESSDPDGSINADTGDKVFGNRAAGDRAFHGIISEIAYYKGTILDADAVTVMYNSGAQGFDLLTDSGNYDNSGDVDGWWKLDNPVTIADLSTNSNTGTVAGSPELATLPEGATADLSVLGTLTQRANSYVFAGVPLIAGAVANGTALQFPPIQFGTGNWTIHFWYKISHDHWGGTSNARLIHSKGNETYYLNLIAYEADNYWCYIRGANGDSNVINANALNVTSGDVCGQWVQMCIRREGASTFTFHSRKIDGTVGLDSSDDKTGTDPGAINLDSPYGLRFGAGHNDTNPYNNASGASFAGVRIWVGEAITDAQINELFEADARFLRSL